MSRETKPTQHVAESDANHRLFSRDEWAQMVKDLKLSPRQSEVVDRIVAGMNDCEVAESLDMAVRTVREHLTHVFRRLGVRDRTQLIVRVFLQFRQADRGRSHRRK